MLRNKVPPFFKASCAGKVFVLGEYAVLAHLPAIVATLGPRFSLGAYESCAIEKNVDFSENSPLGRLVKWAQGAGLPELCFTWDDPYRGAGGFGASTAQFALAYHAYAQKDPAVSHRWTRVWDLYRELMGIPLQGKNIPLPSGADLVAQWQGGVVFFDPAERNCIDVWPLFDWSQMLCFSATGQIGRKVPTHQHLENLAQGGLLVKGDPLVLLLEEQIQKGIEAIRENDGVSLGKVIDQYADALWNAGLECEATHQDRQALRRLEGVAGVKGAGALQSDAVLVLVSPGCNREMRDRVIEAAIGRGLTLVADGLDCQMGVAKGS